MARIRLQHWVYGAFILILCFLPLLLQATGQLFYQDLTIRMMILALAAISLNLILGYGGMISLGHAAYLGIGAYSVGIPAYYDLYSAWLHLPLAIGLSALFALITGAICLRTRGVYFIMITMAFAQMAFYLFQSLEEYGGDDGLVIYERSIFGMLDISTDIHLYYLILAILLLSLYGSHRLVHARFGRVIVGSRSNDRRMQALGFNTYRYRLVCYVISGALCGLAGALLGNFTYFISPDMMSWTRSGELLFMVVLGGAGSLFGPLLGAAAFIVLEELLSAYTTYWQLIFGLLLIAVVLYGRGGIAGWLK